MNVLSFYKISRAALTIFLSALMLFSSVSKSDTKEFTKLPYLLVGAGVASLAAAASIIYIYKERLQKKNVASPARHPEIKNENAPDHQVQKKAEKNEPSEKVSVVLDFDRCLMKDNFCYPHRDTSIAQVKVSENDFGLKSPRKDLNAFLDDQRVRLSIASFGRKDIINKALDLVIDEKHRDKIIVKTPQDVGGRDWYHPNPANKNKMIEQIAQETGIPFERTILFDDNSRNLTDTQKIGVASQYAEPFDENSLNVAKGFINKHSGVRH
jgi:hypothetical protein